MSLQIIQKRNGRDNPAIAKCKCGAEIVLDGDSMGECGCDKCERVYNIFGQVLVGFTQAFSGSNEFGEYYDEY
jgi:hypothetical protein